MSMSYFLLKAPFIFLKKIIKTIKIMKKIKTVVELIAVLKTLRKKMP